MFFILKQEKNISAYVSKHNPNHEKQVMLLMIPNRKRWHYIVVKIICIIKRISIKKPRWFLLFELPSLFKTEKQTWIT